MYDVIFDYIKTNYFVIFYGITWIIAIISYKKYFDTLLRYFPIFISFTFFVELLGSLILYYDNFQLIFDYGIYDNNTFVIYNIYNLFYFLYFYYLFWNVINNGNKKKIIKYGGGLFILINLINLSFQNVLIESLVYSYLFGTILLIYCSGIYLKKIFNENNFSIIKHNLLFWISLGLFIFHIVYLPLKIFREFNYDLYEPLRELHLSMIILMYIFFSIGFITARRNAFR